MIEVRRFCNGESIGIPVEYGMDVAAYVYIVYLDGHVIWSSEVARWNAGWKDHSVNNGPLPLIVLVCN